jgi:hypothetical protein
MTSEINKEITRITVNSVEHSNHSVSISSKTRFDSGDPVTSVKQRRSEDNHSPASSAQVTKAIQSPLPLRGFNIALRNKFVFAMFLKLAKELAAWFPSNSFFFAELIKCA